MEKISIVIPAYNEEGNLGRLLDSLIALRDREKWDCEIIVANDNSRDSTGKIADEYASKHQGIIPIHREKGDNGMGFALIEGTKKSSGDVIVWVMGDCSDSMDTIPAIVNRISQGYDMVIGSRYMSGGSRGDLSADKAMLGRGYTTISRFIFGIEVHDITNAFRGFRRKVFEDINPQSGDFAISPEFSIRTHMRGYKLGEVPTVYINRIAGKPKFKLLKMGVRYVSLFRYRFIR